MAFVYSKAKIFRLFASLRMWRCVTEGERMPTLSSILLLDPSDQLQIGLIKLLMEIIYGLRRPFPVTFVMLANQIVRWVLHECILIEMYYIYGGIRGAYCKRMSRSRNALVLTNLIFTVEFLLLRCTRIIWLADLIVVLIRVLRVRHWKWKYVLMKVY